MLGIKPIQLKLKSYRQTEGKSLMLRCLIDRGINMVYKKLKTKTKNMEKVLSSDLKSSPRGIY